jgi:hypothetical protein
MDETVISWNLPNIISVILMLMIIWMAFGFVGHFVFRKGGTAKKTNGSTPFTASPDLQTLGG